MLWPGGGERPRAPREGAAEGAGRPGAASQPVSAPVPVAWACFLLRSKGEPRPMVARHRRPRELQEADWALVGSSPDLRKGCSTGQRRD